MSAKSATADKASLSVPREQAASAAASHRILVVSSVFPSSAHESYGIFVKERLRSVGAIDEIDVRVVAPTPYFPRLPIETRWGHWSRFPKSEIVDGLEVLRPRYPMLPKVGGYVEAPLMYHAACRGAESILADGYEFDVIDAHFVYPNGVVGAKLGRRYHKPVVITGRGEDILRFPDLPVIGKQIRWAIKNASQFIALSEEIAAAFERQGAPFDRIHVIPNGVDCKKFRPMPREVVRGQLGLPHDRPIVVSIGQRRELKGFHLLVDAASRIRQVYPNVLIVIVGGAAPYGQDYTPEIEARIRDQQLEDHVILCGGKRHDQLAQYYSAADVFALLSSREGSPNVVLEALACGTPVVATPVGGIPQMLREEGLGLVLPERSVAAATEGLVAALGQVWDRDAIRRSATRCSWERTANNVRTVFERAMAHMKSRRGR